MSKKFNLGTKTIEDATFVKISGVIDEDNRLASSLKKIDGTTVVLDLEEIVRINSCGVRDWVNWINDLDARGKQVILVKCSPVIVTQLNVVNNFVGRGMVKSFFAPYYCSNCDTEQLRLLSVGEFSGQSAPKAPAVQCRACGSPKTEFDDLEDAYFAFLPRNAGKVVDPALEQHIRKLSPSIQERIQRLDKVEAEEGTPTSGSYSPLTATVGSGIDISRDSINAPGPDTPPAPPAKSKGTLSAMLMFAAVALAIGLIGYVLYMGN